MTEDWVEVPFEVQKPQAGLRLDAFLARRLERYSRAEVQRFIEEGRVFLRGRAAKASARVADRDDVVVRYPRHQEPPCPHAELPVLYEDADVLAVNKPAGLLSHPTDKIVENTATSILRRQFPALKLHLAHRLDRDTSGVLLFAKNPQAARLMNESFFARKVQKEYLALVEGPVSWDKKTVDVPIGREGRQIKVRQAARADGQAALTDFEVVSRGARRALLRARPKTGRLHQIRVHLAHLGHRIIGDKLYMGNGELYMKMVEKKLMAADIESLGAERQLLHAHKLTLPRGSGTKTIIAPLHDDFKEKLAESGLAGPL